MGRGDVIMTFDADTASAVQSIMTMRDHLIALGQKTQEAGQKAKESGDLFEKFGDTVKDSMKEAAAEIGLVTSVAAGVGLAVETILDGINKKIEETKDRAEKFRTEAQTVSESLAASGQIGAFQDVHEFIEKMSGQSYSGQQFSTETLSKVFTGISNNLGPTSDAETKKRALNAAAQAMAGGSGEGDAINVGTEYGLLSRIRRPGQSESDFIDMAKGAATYGIDAKDLGIINEFSDPQEGLRAVEASKQDDVRKRAMLNLATRSSESLDPAKQNELLLRVAGSDPDDAALKLLPPDILQAAQAAKQKAQQKADADLEARITEHQTESRQRYALEDKEQADRESLMKPREKKKAQQEYALRVADRPQEEADYAADERARARPLKSTPIDEAGVRDLLLNAVTGNKIEALLNDPNLSAPEQRSDIAHLKEGLEALSKINVAGDAAAFNSSEASDPILAARQTAAFKAGTDAAAAIDADTEQAIEDARTALFVRDHPDIHGVVPDWFKANNPLDAEDSAGDKWQDAHTQYTPGGEIIGDVPAWPEKERLKLLLQMERDQKISPGAPATQPATPPPVPTPAATQPAPATQPAASADPSLQPVDAITGQPAPPGSTAMFARDPTIDPVTGRKKTLQTAEVGFDESEWAAPEKSDLESDKASGRKNGTIRKGPTSANFLHAIILWDGQEVETTYDPATQQWVDGKGGGWGATGGLAPTPPPGFAVPTIPNPVPAATQPTPGPQSSAEMHGLMRQLLDATNRQTATLGSAIAGIGFNPSLDSDLYGQT